MRIVCIIPARYLSKRFPGKVLAPLGDKSVIQWVYEQVSDACEETIIATDDERVFNHVISFGGKVMMTSPRHKCGTERCYEAYSKLQKDFDVIINVQGDEPFIEKRQILSLADCFNDPSVQIASLAYPITGDGATMQIKDTNVTKVVMDYGMNAIYFSRQPIPLIRDARIDNWTELHTFYKHIGVYAFKPDVLKCVISLPESSLEKAERLEQLRWIENGYRIKMVLSQSDTIGIDSYADLETARTRLMVK